MRKKKGKKYDNNLVGLLVFYLLNLNTFKINYSLKKKKSTILKSPIIEAIGINWGWVELQLRNYTNKLCFK